jgi:Rho-binding antiterminator
MTESSSYNPVDCGLHSRFELAVMRARPLILGWRQPDGAVRREPVLPLDLATREGAEYLLVEAGGERLQLRLDWIVDNDALPG